MDNEEEEKQKEEAGQKTAHVAGKAAATYFGGAAGTKVYDMASHTAVGQALEKNAGRVIQNTPGADKLSQKLNDSGALDVADKGLDLASGGKTPGGDTLAKGGLDNGLASSANKGTGASKASGLGGGLGLGNKDNKSNTSSDNESEAEATSENDMLGSFLKKHKFKIIGILAGLFFIILVLVTIISVAYSVGDVISNFISNIGEKFSDWFTEDDHEREEKYYEKLVEVQEEVLSKKDVCIDINLITAALTVNTTFDESIKDCDPDDTECQEAVDNDDSSETSTEETSSTTEVDYKKMKKQVELLAEMQVMTKKYSLDKDYKETNGDYCKDTEETVVVTSENESSFDKSNASWLADKSELDSSTAELIAGHDVSKAKFLFKKADEETNYAYYLYYPKSNEDGSCDAKEKDDEYELSIGDSSSMEESVFYWNLVNSFIPEYYKEYLPDENDEDYDKTVKQIAEDIYLLYKSMGPSMSCSSGITSYIGYSTLCPNGVTIEGEGTFDLEEYVAGVVSNEAYTSEGIEALKAQAVAARTYVLNYTNYCEKTISNSTKAQTFTRNVNDNARVAASSTAGEILVDSNGNIFSAQYDSFCYDDNDCPDAKRNSDGTYTVKYTKLPNGEVHYITLSDKNQYGRILNGQGHAHGMSQLVSYQMAASGSTYTEILDYFYSDGVKIYKAESLGSGSSLTYASSSAKEKLNYLFPAGIPSSAAEAEQYMVTIQVPTVDIEGNKTYKNVRLHKSLAEDFMTIMTSIANSGFPIKDVACYNWRNAAASSSRSHHSYGVACDLNVNENYMIKNGQVQAGSYWRPGENPYSFTENGVVVSTFKKYGWTWGGTWNSSKDYMHFSFTGY